MLKTLLTRKHYSKPMLELEHKELQLVVPHALCFVTHIIFIFIHLEYLLKNICWRHSL